MGEQPGEGPLKYPPDRPLMGPLMNPENPLIPLLLLVLASRVCLFLNVCRYGDIRGISGVGFFPLAASQSHRADGEYSFTFILPNTE